MKDQLVYAKQSKIHGMGLFAKKNIKAGEVLGSVEGKATKRDGPYVLWRDEKNGGFKVDCVLKYINHNSRPNACYYDDLTVVALRNIKKNDEITHDYGDDWDE